MKLRIKIFALFIITSFSSKAQTSIELEGKVRNDSIFLQNIQIINLSSKTSSISNDLGVFLIKVKLGDSLLFKSLTQKDRKLKITNTHINNAKLIVYLEPRINKLDEVFIENSFFNRKEYVKTYLTFNKTQLEGNSFLSNKAQKNKIDARAMTDPTYNGGNINIGKILVNLYKVIWKKNIETKKEKQKIEASIKISKKEFTDNVLEQFNEKFFLKHLNIQTDKVNLFLDYCINNGLDNYYNSKEIEIVNFLIIQSKKFNEISK